MFAFWRKALRFQFEAYFNRMFQEEQSGAAGGAGAAAAAVDGEEKVGELKVQLFILLLIVVLVYY